MDHRYHGFLGAIAYFSLYRYPRLPMVIPSYALDEGANPFPAVGFVRCSILLENEAEGTGSEITSDRIRRPTFDRTSGLVCLHLIDLAVGNFRMR